MKLNLLVTILALLLSSASCKKKPRTGSGGGYGGPIGDLGSPPNQWCPRDAGSGSDEEFPQIANAPDTNLPWKREWSELIYDKLEEPYASVLTQAEFSDNDVKLFGCPNLNSLSHKDVKKMWIAFFGSLSLFEGEHEADDFYPDSRYGAGRDSYGVFMIDPVNCRRWSKRIGSDLSPSGNGIGRSGGGSSRNPDPSRIGGSVFDDLVNTECAVNTMIGSTLLDMKLNKKKKMNIFRNKTQYWAPLKSGFKRRAKFIATLQAHMKQIPGCFESGPDYAKKSPYGESVEGRKPASFCSTSNGKRDLYGKHIESNSNGFETTNSNFNSISK